MTDCDLQNRFEILQNEFQVCERKLASKCDALMILSHELDECRGERDQFKLMGEQVQERYQALKRRLSGMGAGQNDYISVQHTSYADMENQCLARLLCETKEMCKCQKFDIDDLKQKLKEARGDIKLLREQIARQRVGTTDEGLNTRHFPAYERQDLISRLEGSTQKYSQLQKDLQQVIDEKEELETERDAYKTKYERLNIELNHILKGDDSRIIDIDALNTENKFLKERIKQMEEEKSTTTATVSKYKSMLEKKKMKGVLKLGQNRSGGAVITHKQVRQLLDEGNLTHPSPQALADLHALASALLETVNDKNLVLSHQRKANKILGNRVSELERKLKTLEVSGLWNYADSASYLEKLRAECEEVKTLIPGTQSSSASHDGATQVADGQTHSPVHSPSWGLERGPHLEHELDLLPTKENVMQEATVVVTVERLAATATDSESQLSSSPRFDDQSITSSQDNASHDHENRVSVDKTTVKLSNLIDGLRHHATDDLTHVVDTGKTTNSVDTYAEKTQNTYTEISTPDDDDNDSVECKLLSKKSPEHHTNASGKNLMI